MRNFFAGMILSALLIASVSYVQADPGNRFAKHGFDGNGNGKHQNIHDDYDHSEDDAKIVAYYEDGRHEIPGEEGKEHYGRDLVMRAGKSGNFHQWFYGHSDEEGLHGEHTVWKEKKHEDCPGDWMLIEDAYPQWGDYLEPGADYCVKTNDFHVSH